MQTTDEVMALLKLWQQARKLVSERHDAYGAALRAQQEVERELVEAIEQMLDEK